MHVPLAAGLQNMPGQACWWMGPVMLLVIVAGAIRELGLAHIG